jgi:hypothetical protein
VLLGARGPWAPHFEGPLSNRIVGLPPFTLRSDSLVRGGSDALSLGFWSMEAMFSRLNRAPRYCVTVPFKVQVGRPPLSSLDDLGFFFSPQQNFAWG